MGADATISKRLAGDKDRKYALVKNEDGWTLALEGNSEDNPIQVDSMKLKILHVKSIVTRKI